MPDRTRIPALLVAAAVASEFAAAPGSAAEDELMQRAQEVFQPIPEQPPSLADNPITPDKVELGKMLFFEPRLSESWMLSCNACHNLATGGVDLQETSIGHGWRKGPRNAPTVLNAAFNIAQFWDGRAKDLEEQATGPMMNPGEMGSSAERVMGTLRSIPEYGERFERAFPGEADPVSLGNVAKAIAAFEAAALLTPNAPLDRYLAGDAGSLSEQQKAGLHLFMEKGCVSCHYGTNVGGGRYARFGEVQTPGADLRSETDKGRFTVTSQPEDEYVFRVAPLRNVALTPPYFHSGQVWDLEDAVAIMGRAQLGLELAEEEVRSIAEFLTSLTGEQPRIVYPVLPVVASDTPLPKPYDNP
jgi:cytochrome c peroxidase